MRRPRRLYERFEVDLRVTIVSKPSDRAIEGEILNLGIGGALLRVRAALETEIRMTFQAGGVDCVLDAYVIRREVDANDSDRARYGVEFHPNPEMEKKLKKILQDVERRREP